MKPAALLVVIAGPLASLAMLTPSHADPPRIGGAANLPGVAATTLRAGGKNPRPTSSVITYTKPTPKDAPPPPKPADPPGIKTPPGALGQVFKIWPGLTPTAAAGVQVMLSATGLLVLTPNSQPVFQMLQHTTGMTGTATINFTPESATQNYAFSCGVKSGAKYNVVVDAYYIGSGGASFDHDTVLLNETTSAAGGNIIVSYDAVTPQPSFITVFLSSVVGDWQLTGCEGYRMP